MTLWPIVGEAVERGKRNSVVRMGRLMTTEVFSQLLNLRSQLMRKVVRRQLTGKGTTSV